jgi:hypothetical protein
MNFDSPGWREARAEYHASRGSTEIIPLRSKLNGGALQEPFPLTPFGQIKLNAEETNYIFKGLLPRSGLAVVWGPPKSGKSFWCMDLLLHAALGWEYRGHKVQQANVVYVALEGRNGIPARVEAFKIRHEVNEAPFYLITHPVNLIVDADALIASIRAQGVVPAWSASIP